MDIQMDRYRWTEIQLTDREIDRQWKDGQIDEQTDRQTDGKRKGQNDKEPDVLNRK